MTHTKKFIDLENDYSWLLSHVKTGTIGIGDALQRLDKINSHRLSCSFTVGERTDLRLAAAEVGSAIWIKS